MVTVSGNDIALTRGDSLLLGLRFAGRVVPHNARALASIKRSPRDSAALIEKELPICDNTALWSLDPQDTRALPARTYFWDVRVLYDDGKVVTPMEYAAFEIVEVIGNAH